MKKLKKLSSGFTLVELLVVIAIIAILAAVVVLIVNPLEVTRRARDATRLADLANVQQAINVTVQESTAAGTTTLCDPPSTVNCRGESTAANATSSDGDGWVKVNLQLQNAVSVPNLPLDPTNTNGGSADTGGFHYTYCSDGVTWEMNANLESAQQKPKEGTDGGDDPALYETGSDPGLNLIAGASGCTWD